MWACLSLASHHLLQLGKLVLVTRVGKPTLSLTSGSIWESGLYTSLGQHNRVDPVDGAAGDLARMCLERFWPYTPIPYGVVGEGEMLSPIPPPSLRGIRGRDDPEF